MPWKQNCTHSIFPDRTITYDELSQVVVMRVFRLNQILQMKINFLSKKNKNQNNLQTTSSHVTWLISCVFLVPRGR